MTIAQPLLVAALALVLVAAAASAADRPPLLPTAGPLDNRLCRVESRPGGPVTGDPTPWVEWIAAAGTDLWVCSAVDPNDDVNYASKVGYPCGDFDPEYLPKLLRLAHERDIAVISWFGPIWSRGAGRAHPEWRQVFLEDPNQPPLKEDDVGWLCPNNPEARAFLKAELAEIVGPLGFDGIWFDGTVFGSMLTIPFRAGCRCPYCTARYRADTGLDIPPRVDMSDPAFRRFVRWRYQVMDDYMLDLTEAIRAANPQAHVAIGNYYRPGHGWDAGTYMAPQKASATASGEANIVGDMAYETVNTGFNGRLVKAINPYSFELWRPMWDFQINVLPRPEIVQTEMALLLEFAQGGHTFCGYPRDGTEAQLDLKPAFDELKRRAPWHGGEPLRFAGVHYSQRARDFTCPGGGPEYDRMVSGIHQALAESHVIFDFVLDGQLTPEALRRFRVVILPGSGCLNDEEAQGLRGYVEAGGHLIVCGETSLYDDLGQRREDLLLSDLLGVHYTASQPMQPYPKTAPVGVIEDQETLATLPRLCWFMSPYCEVEPRPDVAPEVLMAVAQGNEAVGLADATAVAMQQPLATLRRLGRGEAIYLAPDLGRAYAEHPYQRLRRLLATWVNRAEPWLRVEAPKVVEVTAFERDGATIIHLVNSPLTSLRPTVMTGRMPLVDEVVPVHDLGVSLRGEFATARLEPSGLDLPVTHAEGWSTVTVPEVEIHEMVVWRR